LVGFASGVLSSAASSLWSGGGADQWQGFGGKFADSDIGMRLIIHDPTPRINHFSQRGVHYNNYVHSN
jgi:hypothetical protein